MELGKETLASPRTKIEVIYAGGTISSLATPAGYREGGHEVDLISRLEDRRPGFTKRFDIGKPQVAYTGLSENVGRDDLLRIEEAIDIALGKDPNSILMSFGTDFAEQAAKRFQNKYRDQLKRQGIKIIIVTANDDLSHPKTDAWDNLTFSLESAAGDAESGVYLGFHGRLIPADLVIKEPFNNREMNFRSKDDPAYMEAVKEHEQQSQQLVNRLETTLSNEQLDEEVVLDYPVNVFRLNHQELLDRLENSDVGAILLTLYHSGTANTTDSPASVSRLVNLLRARGLVVFGVTENGEPVDLHSYETSVKLREAGVIPLYDMQKEVALAKLQRVIPAVNSIGEIIDKMLTNLVGEIDEDRVIPEDIKHLKELYR